jgi:hypothetical protein
MTDEEFRDRILGRKRRDFDDTMLAHRFRQAFVHSDPAVELGALARPETGETLMAGQASTYTDASIRHEPETLVLHRWRHPTPPRYYTGDARMPVPPMTMLRPLVRVLAGG